MNNAGNSKRSDSKPNTSRTNSSKPTRGGAGKSEAKPAMSKRAPGVKKTKIANKAAKAEAEKVIKTPNQAPKRLKEKDEIRLNKFISNSGECSRRDADIYIQSGNVKVNGQVVTEMGYLVKLTDTVNFDGKNLTPEKKEYILLNKPKNFTTSEEEYNMSRNVFELVKGSTTAKIAPVGRMDKNTTGLLLFTNDTDMIRKFGLPSQKLTKTYQVKISKGVTIDNHKIHVEEISYVEGESKSEIGLKLRSSNIKVVRHIFEHYKYDVIKIDRVAFAGLTKKNLPRGNWRLLTDQEIINLKNV
jgi:23S rRNA pseudouridine2605 synthase